MLDREYPSDFHGVLDSGFFRASLQLQLCDRYENH